MPISLTISVLRLRNQKRPARLRDGFHDSDRSRRYGGRFSAYTNDAWTFVASPIRSSFGTWGRDWLYFSDDGANGFVSDVAGNFAGYRRVYCESIRHAHLSAQLDAGRKRRGRPGAP